ncbi:MULTISPECIES: hypothetical protein [unclassified Mesorhizobium]|uniref:hypothetical protein n=1 Tax=unclassified Mesorhizobium TaxID=325217 RepID=UPI00112AF411|nr:MULTISPECIES: hypothetical protein [unclassified Mesorhizobium]TPI51708.1 hypothetical protein FJW11_19475 [Mesorhizobium sp. B3-1-1]TPJ60534.1 hypothetical protein FJ462_28450 [Mesorhizobium sp. B2-6-7]TPJ77898.1 hypothetical protein FJ422_27860 [Mesorhizobium sp. B2-6-3]TPJ92560.1 hypothetical protein FJ491_29210 [Mesorhizobium sp. B2-5-10]TPK11065.1 hypothetical protein FJ490_13440 [Mesorhizobium sp. B2-5-11]
MFINRRDFLLMTASVASVSVFSHTGRSQAATEIDLVNQYDALISDATPEVVAKVRGLREYVDLTAGLETSPTQEAPSATPISSRATDLLIRFEVSSGEVYEKLYQAPTWPKGQSGVTMGVGYDLGYADGRAIRKDWASYVEKAAVDRLVLASGIIGKPAKKLAAEMASIRVPFAVAHRQFLELMQPRYVGITERALPNFGDLPEDCRGALVSLVYNRGASFSIPKKKDPHGRYKEMRAIRQLMVEKNYSGIPEQMLKMRRLWAGNLRGVAIRRELEATLFLIGLSKLS